MTLSGLLDAVLPDPALSRAVSAAVTSAGVASLDLAAPPALRPLVAAALAADPDRGGAGRPVLAVTATGRDADDLVDALRCLLPAGRGGRLPVLGDAAARAAVARARTPIGRRLAVLRRLAHPEHRRPGDRPGPGGGRLDPRGAAAAGARPRRAGAGRGAGRRHRRARRPCRAAGRASATPGSSWSRSAASSPSAAASSTSSRRPRSTRSGSSSGATTSRRSASSRSPTSARPGPAEHGLWAPPCRELLLTPPVRERAKRLAAEHPELAEMLDRIADGTAGRGHGGARPGPGRRAAAGAARAAGRHARAGLRPGAGADPGGRAGRGRRRSSWPRPGPPRPAAAPRRSTSARRRCARSRRCARRRRRAGPARGGRSPRSPPTPSWTARR